LTSIDDFRQIHVDRSDRPCLRIFPSSMLKSFDRRFDNSYSSGVGRLAELGGM